MSTDASNTLLVKLPRNPQIKNQIMPLDMTQNETDLTVEQVAARHQTKSERPPEEESGNVTKRRRLADTQSEPIVEAEVDNIPALAVKATSGGAEPKMLICKNEQAASSRNDISSPPYFGIVGLPDGYSIYSDGIYLVRPEQVLCY